MQPGSHLSLSTSSDSSTSTDRPLAVPHDDAESGVSAFASRVFRQVFSARVLGTPSDEDFGELGLAGDFVHDDCDEKDDDHEVMSSASETTVSTAPSMSISFIARAEQLLQKSVPLVNGGRHISITKEDVERIRDKELLRFLETNSAMFVKYLHRRGEGASVESTEATKTREHVNIEQKINDLANEIETFITACDNDGDTYRICVDKEGTLLVPVGAEEEEEEGEDALSAVGVFDEDELGSDEGSEEATMNMGTVGDMLDVPSSVAAGMETAAGEDNVQSEATANLTKQKEPRVPLRVGKSEGSGKLLGRDRLGRRVRVHSPPPPPTTSLQTPSSQPKEQQQRLSKGKKTALRTEAKKLSALVKNRSSLRVRGPGLDVDQVRRVEEMMHTDFLADSSPYTLSAERLTALEKRLQWLQEVRGPINNNLDADGDCNEVETGESLKLLQEQQQQQQQRPAAKELGNAYMREVREQQLRYARMRAINARLSQLHDTLRMEALCPKADVEQLVGVPRPAWSHDVPPPPSEDEIAALLENARRENTLALEMGEQLTPSGGDKEIMYLREKVRLALGRVESFASST